MKRSVLTITALFLFTTNYAQDWEPFHRNDKAHFSINAGSSVANTIRVTDETTNGITTTYSFNKIVAKCATCTKAGEYYIDQPQFLGYKMEFANGIYTFQGKDTFIIDANVKLGGNWTFNFTTGVMAEVTEEKEMTYLGVTDSVRVITLSNGGSIELGKQLGIISFDNAGTNSYQLIGEEDKAIGEHVPTFKDFFNYKAGDVLLYEDHSEGAWSMKWHGGITYYHRYLIVDVLHLDDDSAVFEVDYDNYIDEDMIGWPTNTRIKSKQLSQRTKLVFKAFGDKHTTNYSQNEYVPNYGMAVAETGKDTSTTYSAHYSEFYSPGTGSVLTTVKSKNGDGYFKVLSNFGQYIPYYTYNNVRDLLNDSTFVSYYHDEIVLYNQQDINMGIQGESNMVYKEGIGLVASYYEGGVLNGYVSGYIRLKGAQIGGQVYGNLQPDGFFALSIDNVQTTNVLTVYPNPATDQVTIQLEGYQRGEAEVKIYNTSGQVVTSQQHNFNSGDLTMDITTLPKGIYYVKIEADNILTTQKLVIY